MADTYTTNLNLTKPEVGASTDTWGTKLNADLDSLDAIFASNGTSVALNLDGAVIDNSVIGGTTPAAGSFTSLDASGNITVGTSDTIIAENNIRFKSAGASYIDHFTVGQDINFRVSNSSSLDINALTIDSSGNIGFGTTSPNSYSGYTALTLNNTTNGGAIDFENNGTRVGTIFSDQTSTILKTVANVPLLFGTNDAEKMRIDSSGKVGIGTSSPSTKLHLGGTAPLDSIIRQDSTTSGTNWEIGEREAGKWQIFEDDGDSIVATFMSSGNVGIGTTSPYHTFDVFGAVIANGQAKSNGLFFDTTSATTGTGGGIALGGYSNGTGGAIYHFGNIQGIKENSTAGNYASAMLFSTRANGATPTERMRIDSSGNIGIGTTSPTAPLHVVGNAVVTGNIISTGDTNIIYDSDDNCIFSRANGNETMRLDSSGNVGIGTSSPSFKLDVVGTVGLNTSGTGVLTTFGANNTTDKYLRIRNSNGNFELGTNNNLHYVYGLGSTPMGFFTNAAERMRITSAGKFVVGDTAALNSGGALGSFVFSGGQGLFISTVSQSTGEVMGFVHQKTSVVGTIAINSSSTTYNTSSDARLKDITGEARGLEVINELNPVSYNWKADGKADEGLIAQEVEELVPNAVSQNSDQYYQMDYSKLVTYLVKGMQEQQTIIDDLKSRIETLEG